MLNFVIGTAGTGKSTHIIQSIQKLAKSGEKCLLLVPEQFSKTGEALLFSSLDDARTSLVSLYSFSSLVRDVQTNVKKLAANVLSEAGKAVMARRASVRVKNDISIYRSRMDNFAFSASLSRTFDTFKRSGIDSQRLYGAVKNAPDKNAKLKELSLMYLQYSALMGDKFCDGEDLLRLLAENLPARYTYDTNVFIDGFESFSDGQLKVIQRMMTDAKSVTIALTCDSLQDFTGGTGCFSFVQNTAASIIRTAKNAGVKIAPATVMAQPVRFKNRALARVDEFLQTGEGGECPDKDHVFICRYDTRFEEVCAALARVRILVKEGLSYNDIAIVCPQLEKYENLFQETLTRAQIPYFIDSSRIISSSSPVVLFRAIFDIMGEGLNRDNLLLLLKSALTGFADTDIALLENYLYVWQDYNFDFSQDFELSPGGIKSAPTPREELTLAVINKIRKAVFDIFSGFAAEKNSPCTRILENAYRAAVRLGSEEKLKQIIAAVRDEEKAQLLARQWDTVINCLNSLYDILERDTAAVKDIDTLFMLMIQAEKIGFAPQTQDCVMVSDPKRMKLDSVEAVIIIGAAGDIFPAIISESGLIGSEDRRFLKEKDYILNNNFENLLAFENLYYYKALTSPRQYLYISHCKKNIDLSQTASPNVELLAESLGFLQNKPALEDYALTPRFFADYVANLATNTTRQGYVDMLKNAGCPAHTSSQRQYRVQNTRLIDRVLGDSITISPTSAESYFQCSYMYFLKNILKVRPLEKAVFSGRMAGEYLHYIVRRVMEKYGENYRLVPMEEIIRTTDRAVENYIRENYPRQIYSRSYFEAVHRNMKDNAIQLLEYLHSEQENGLFRPIAFEEKIDRGERVPPLQIDAENGKTINIKGVRDRIDIYRGQNRDYLRVVDYKTGNQKFDLDEVYNGLSSQLLLYMNALLNADFAKGEKPLKAGAVMYQHSDAAFKFDKPEDDLYTAVGLALANSEISKAFDQNQKGRFGIISGDEKLKESAGSKIAGEKKFDIILDYVKENMKNMARGVYGGDFSPMPLVKNDGSRPCRFCPYHSVCRYEGDGRAMLKNDFDKREKEE